MDIQQKLDRYLNGHRKFSRINEASSYVWLAGVLVGEFRTLEEELTKLQKDILKNNDIKKALKNKSLIQFNRQYNDVMAKLKAAIEAADDFALDAEEYARDDEEGDDYY